MTANTLDNLYFEWLYSQIGSVSNRNPARSYWSIAHQLHEKIFTWFIPNDDNRVEDGKELRFEFFDEYGITDADPEWIEMECSILEMLIGLSRRASYQSDETPVEWFWKLMSNLGLREYPDSVHTDYYMDIEEVLDRLVKRKYDRDGTGGLFPLINAKRDQRKVELVYQMAAYLLEGG